MTGASRPSVRVGKRTLAAFAAGSIAVPLSFGLMGGTAFAAAQGSSTPPAPTAIDGVCPPGQVPDSNFPDTQNDFFKDAINCLVAYGVTQGYPDGNYKPSLAVNREQMALFFFRVGKAAGANWNTSDAGFKDINTASSQEAKDAINALANAKVIQGFTDGTYRPAVVVHRDAMAKFIANTVKFLGGPDLTTSTNDYYTDDAGNIFENFINGITDGKISNGIGGHLYGPGLPVQRDAMAGFISRSMEVLYEAGKLPSQFNANVSSVTVSPQSQTAGQPVTVTVTPASGAPAISSVKVTGACVPDTTTTTDASSSAAGFQVNVPTNKTATAGTCTLTVVTTFADGTTATNTVPLTVTAAPQTATSLPQLTSAKVLGTTPFATSNGTTPAGTTVQYCFSQAVAAATPGSYLIYPYNWDGSSSTSTGTGALTGAPKLTANTAKVESNGTCVDALFPEVQNTANAPTGVPLGGATGAPANVNNYTLATVQKNAVSTTSGTTNTEGSAPIGSSQSSTTTGTPNTTTAPDLTNVSGFRAGNAANTTAVDFTFDQAAFPVTTSGYNLVLNTYNGVAGVVACTGPAAGSTTASGGTVAGGGGSSSTPTTITVICNDVTAGTPISSADVARAYVVAGTVQAANGSGATNPTEAFHFGRNTTAPDLTSVTLVPGANAATADQVVYVFDQAVTSATAGQFSVFHTDATPTTGTGATVGGAGNNQVAVTYPNGTLVNVVGAVAGAGAATGNGQANAVDELGVTPSSTTNTSITPGVVDGPQLKSVALAKTTDVFGNVTYSATYTFTQPLFYNTTASSLTRPQGGAFASNPNLFKLYLANGTEMVATACANTSTTASNATSNTNNAVTCTAYQVVATATAATQTQISSAALGTVVQDAVMGTSTAAPAPNPEGASNVTPAS